MKRSVLSVEDGRLQYEQDPFRTELPNGTLEGAHLQVARDIGGCDYILCSHGMLSGILSIMATSSSSLSQEYIGDALGVNNIYVLDSDEHISDTFLPDMLLPNILLTYSLEGRWLKAPNIEEIDHSPRW